MAYEFRMALGAASSGLEVNQRKIQSTPEFRRKITAANEALRTYLLAVRAELDLPVPAEVESGDSPTGELSGGG